MSTQADTSVVEKTKFKKPSMWTVVLHNDDYTPMDFVVAVLMHVFHLDFDAAADIMQQVHEEGRAAVGQFTKEVAIAKAELIMDNAAENKHPLKAEAQQA